MRDHTDTKRIFLASANRRGQIMVEALIFATVLTVFMMTIAQLSNQSRGVLKKTTKFSQDRSTR